MSYEVRLTKDEMTLFVDVVRKYRDNFDDYPGSQMVLTSKEDFTKAANLFLDAASRIRHTSAAEAIIPLESLGRTDVEITEEPDGHILIRAGGAIGVLASTAVPYEVDMVPDMRIRDLLAGITNKFLDQKYNLLEVEGLKIDSTRLQQGEIGHA